MNIPSDPGKPPVIDEHRAPEPNPRIPVTLSVVTIVALLIVGSLFYTFLRAKRFDGVRINVAGRQRMLTQRMSKEVLLLPIGSVDRDQVAATARLFDSNLTTLLDGGNIQIDDLSEHTRSIPAMRDAETRRQLGTVRDLWSPFSRHLDAYLADGTWNDLEFVIQNNNALLTEMDVAVQLVQRSADAHNTTMTWTLSILGVLAVAALLIRLRRQIFEVHRARRTIEQLEQLLPICSTCKSIHVENQVPEDPASWVRIERYLADATTVKLTHGLCPTCFDGLMEECD